MTYFTKSLHLLKASLGGPVLPPGPPSAVIVHNVLTEPEKTLILEEVTSQWFYCIHFRTQIQDPNHKKTHQPGRSRDHPLRPGRHGETPREGAEGSAPLAGGASGGGEGLAKKHNESSELADLIRRSIICGELKPRERLTEMALAEKYNVSRTPVREALKHLEALGLVTLERYKGATVADIDLDEIREMHIVRADLEGLAAFLAAPRLSDEELVLMDTYQREMELAVQAKDIQLFSEYNELFHNLFYRGSGNRFLYDSIQNILKLSWHTPCTSWRGLGDVPLTMRGHQRILAALKDRDAERARVMAEQHLLDALNIHDRVHDPENGLLAFSRTW